jgi:hypothetical protein
MAQRYGGKFSPDGSVQRDHSTPPQQAPRNPFDGKRPSRATGRSNLLFITPIPFLINAFRGTPEDVILGIAAGAAFLLAAWLTREGIRAQEAYEARRVARRPAIPRKIFGSVLIGAGIVGGASMGGLGLIYGLAYGVIGAGLHLAAFGPDPLRDKGLEGVDQFQTDRVARAVEDAERHLTAMRDAILRAGDRGLEARVDRFATTARGLFRTVEADPGDLTAARKYLSVYLQGARDATAKFADIYAQNRSAKARADYEALLDDLETTFASRTTALLENNHTDLDIEIGVLRDRLKFEAPRP